MPRKKARVEVDPPPEKRVEDDFDAETAEGVGELDQGMTVENEEVIRWLRSWGSESELPMPQPKPKRKD
jgi:hypothetical protein